MKLCFALAIILLLTIPPHQAGAEVMSCADLFYQVPISEENRTNLPTLFRDPETDPMMVMYFQSAINSNPRWSYVLGDARIVQIKSFSRERGPYIEIEFTLLGEELNSRVHIYFKMEPRPGIVPSEIYSLMEIYKISGGGSAPSIVPFPNSEYLAKLPIESQRQIGKDLAHIGIRILEVIPDSILLESGMSRERIKLNLDLQARGLYVVDSSFNILGESPALWLLRFYLRTLQLQILPD
jgi:hypothetical protein